MLNKEILRPIHNKSKYLKTVYKFAEHLPQNPSKKSILKPINLDSSPQPEVRKHSRKNHRKLINSMDSLPVTLNLNPQPLISKGRSLDRLAPLRKQTSLSSNPKFNLKNQPQGVSKIPSVIQSISSKTLTGWVNGKPKKANQDSYVITHNFNSSKSQTLLGVMDGHGVFGDQVSSFIRAYLPIFLTKNTQDLLKNESNYPLAGKQEFEIVSAISEAYSLTHNELWKKSNIDINFSGSTAITVLIRGNQCICSNCGDSRAIIGRYGKDGWSSVKLSEDHKPENPAERIRIEKSGGRIESYKDNEGRPLGPARVWLKNEQFPGLAMSRSIGDLISIRAGIVCTPDVLIHNFDPQDKFLVLASDGVWEFISNDECVQIISNFYFSGKLYEACEQLANIATFRWNRQDGNVDDITIIIVSLKIKDE